MEVELGIKMFLPTVEQFEARHKPNLYEFGKKYGIKVPFAQLVFDGNDIPQATSKFGFPVVVKGKYYDAKIAYNNEQATQYFNKISAQWGLPILFQEFVQGTEVNVCGIADGQGNLMGAVPMRKLYITDKGKAWAGVSLDDKKLIEITKKMVSKTKWRGPFEMEFVKKSEEEYFLIEINPRFPAWCFLTVGAGQNQMEALVNIALGKNVVPYTDYKIGTMFIRYSNDLIVDIKEFEKISTDGEL
jgi:carbamoyl-phosphate synthase large subunit